MVVSTAARTRGRVDRGAAGAARHSDVHAGSVPREFADRRSTSGAFSIITEEERFPRRDLKRRHEMEAPRIAQVLESMGTLLEVRGENPFRCRAYHNAAQVLRGLPNDLSGVIADGTLAELPGIGETMHKKIVELATTGRLEAFEKLQRETPPGLVALLRVPGLGPKKIKTLHDALKIESLADLQAAGKAGKIADLKGFGAKTQAKILEGVAFIESTGDRILQSQARRLVAPVFQAIRAHPAVLRRKFAAVCAVARKRSATSTSFSARSTRFLFSTIS